VNVGYNEKDVHAAAWLRNLIAAGLIQKGEVDERSIADLRAPDLAGFDTAHFFAGIGGWPYALALAGWPSDRPVWTGSCPCQPFSAAGKRKGEADERHLWPAWFSLIRECRPDCIFGEQVGGNDGYRWVDGVRTDLEKEGYAVGVADLPACIAGSPHIRNRLFWVAYNCGAGLARRTKQPTREKSATVKRSGSTGGVGVASVNGDRAPSNGRSDSESQDERRFSIVGGSGAWSDFTILPCRDGKARRTQSGLFPLVDGLPFRLADGRTREEVSRAAVLRGIGNAIVPQVAARFIRAFSESKLFQRTVAKAVRP
jgi:DNA (cytosine-5)-methyltransferase 1